MLVPDDIAASVPHVLSDVVVLQNMFRLPGTADRKHPEHLVKTVEKALPKDMNHDQTKDVAIPSAADRLQAY